MESIHICNNDLNEELFQNIMFFMIAEAGAMGDMGAINFIKTNGKLYYLNYLWDDITLDEVSEKFPPLSECYFGLCGLDSEVPAGWHYVNLGAGNHLIVNDVVYPQFAKLIKNYKHMGEIYRDWIKHADYIINKKPE